MSGGVLPPGAGPGYSDAPRVPVIVPAGLMPETARERFAKPPAGTALAPMARHASGTTSFT